MCADTVTTSDLCLQIHLYKPHNDPKWMQNYFQWFLQHFQWFLAPSCCKYSYKQQYYFKLFASNTPKEAKTNTHHGTSGPLAMKPRSGYSCKTRIQGVSKNMVVFHKENRSTINSVLYFRNPNRIYYTILYSNCRIIAL